MGGISAIQVSSDLQVFHPRYHSLKFLLTWRTVFIGHSYGARLIVNVGLILRGKNILVRRIDALDPVLYWTKHLHITDHLAITIFISGWLLL
jgi:hypothetical protein